MTFAQKIGGLVLTGLISANVVLAQATPPSSTTAPDGGPGLLGKRYLGMNLYTVAYRNSESNNAYGGSSFVDVPVGQHLDLNGGVSFAERDNSYIIDNGKDVSFGADLYTQFHGVTPFAGAGIAYEKFTRSVSGLGTVITDETVYYGFEAGAEFPLNQVSSLAAIISTSSAMESGASFFWSYTLKGIYWLSPRIASVGTIGFHEDVSVSYSLGLRFLF